MSKFLLTSVENGICTLSLNRPEVMNALNHALFEELEAALKQLAESGDEVRCLILKGNGKAFSSGHDLRDIGTGAEGEISRYEATVLDTLANLPMPTIAQVHGYCFTGALELALACDLIFADTSTRLADTHSKWGLSPIWGMTQRLPRRIGAARAKDLMYSARQVEASEALAIGLVDRVFEAGQMEDETRAYALTVVDNSPHSQRVYKQIMAATDGMDLPAGLDYEYSNSPGVCSDMKQRIERFTKK